MKRGDLVRHPQDHGCRLAREGSGHSIWINSATNGYQPIPRHREIPDILARKICRGLNVPDPKPR